MQEVNCIYKMCASSYDTQPFTSSYKQKILSELAEVLMSGHSSMTKEQALPDIVQCTQLSRHKEYASRESTLQQWTHRSKVVVKKMTKQAAAKTLREFMKYDLSLLDKESRYGLSQAHFLLKLD